MGDKSVDGRIYPCTGCGVMRTKSEGGGIFTLCDECWKKAYPPNPQSMAPPNPWGDQEVMVIAAFRYSLGRMTYVVQDCCDWLIEQWPNFEERTRELIQKELEAAFRDDNEARRRKREYRPLGHDCDRVQWERVRKLWEGER